MRISVLTRARESELSKIAVHTALQKFLRFIGYQPQLYTKPAQETIANLKDTILLLILRIKLTIMRLS